jgi:hypothetical protein
MDKYKVEPAVKTHVEATSEAGYIQLRRRVTFIPLQYHIEYELMTKADVAALDSFWESAIGLPFNWTEPRTGVVKAVKFIKMPSTSGVDAAGNYYNSSFDLVDA